MLANGAASTILADSAYSPVLTYACSTTILALVAPPAVLQTKAAASTLLALITPWPVLFALTKRHGLGRAVGRHKPGVALPHSSE